MHTSLTRIGLIAAALPALLAATCNDPLSNSSSSGNTTGNQSAAGVWSGSDSDSGLGVTALVNPAGVATFIRSDGVQFAGTVAVSGSTLAATVNGYTNFGATFSDGSTSGLGTLNGTVTTQSALTAVLSFSTSGSTQIPGSWSLSYESLSNNSSSTATVSGNYTDSVAAAVLSINSNGEMTQQNATNGCVLNGSISTGQSSLNIYEVSYTLGSCTGTAAVLNGVQFTGLATLNNSVSPAQLTIAVQGTSSSMVPYGIVSTLTAS